MEIVFQPSASDRLGDFLNVGFSGNWSSFRSAVAFVKRSGVRHIEGGLTSFVARGRGVEIIAGIDHRGTSHEGLQSLLDSVASGGRVVVFHNPGLLTFHPKVYVFKSSSAADVFIGSGNLTAGGLYANYELGVRLTLDLDDPAHASFLASLERRLDEWSDEASGTARVLDQELLADLNERGLTPSERLLTPPLGGAGVGGFSNTAADFPFTSNREPGPPGTPGERQRLPADTQCLLVSALPAADEVNVPRMGFVMTLQQTDAGVGQTTPGTASRSPEIFIPLVARDEEPDFWGWPGGFINDQSIAGKRDRFGVRVRMGRETFNVNVSYFHHRRDFRVRSERLRSAGRVGDILRLESAANLGAGYDYYAEVISQGSPRFAAYDALCRSRVRGSQKRYGYY